MDDNVQLRVLQSSREAVIPYTNVLTCGSTALCWSIEKASTVYLSLYTLKYTM